MPSEQSSTIEGNDILRITEEQRAMLERTLQRAETALNDWVHSYAPEFCDNKDVQETNGRLSEGGTLWYIATVLQEVRAARKWLSE